MVGRITSGRRGIGASTADDSRAVARERALELQPMIDALPEQVALLDTDFSLLTTNRAWQRYAQDRRCGALGDDDNFLHYCERLARAGNGDAAAIAEGLRGLTRAQAGRVWRIYSDEEGREFRISISLVRSNGGTILLVTQYELVSLRPAEGPSRRLGSALLEVQMEERRRIGRDLHDATAQSLVALNLALARLRRNHGDVEAVAVFDDIDEILSQIHREIRTIAFTLHPPPLQHGNLGEALATMTRGFAARTGLGISFTAEGVLPALPNNAETALYRVAQEALANVYRHARATEVKVCLICRRRRHVHLLIKDDGIGARPVVQAGVGIASMQSRITDIGGRIRVSAFEFGTVVVASLDSTSLESH